MNGKISSLEVHMLYIFQRSEAAFVLNGIGVEDKEYLEQPSIKSNIMFGYNKHQISNFITFVALYRLE